MDNLTTETYRGLRIERGQFQKLVQTHHEEPKTVNRFYVKIWHGKQSRPYAYYGFKTVEARETYVQEQKAADDRSFAYKVERDANRRVAKEKATQSLAVGTLLHASWGYDQTQCDFYEVVRRPSKYVVVIRRIAGNYTETGRDCGRSKPCPGQFLEGKEGEETTHRIVSGDSIKVRDWGVWARPCLTTDTFHESSYA